MNKNLALLLSGQFVSQIGDKFYMLALAIWVLDTTNSPAMMGGVLFCSFFPTFLVGFVAGAFVDKYDRKIIIVAADCIRGLVIVVVTWLYYFNLLNIHTIFISQILLSDRFALQLLPCRSRELVLFCSTWDLFFCWVRL